MMILVNIVNAQNNDSTRFAPFDTSFCKYLTAENRSEWNISSEDSATAYNEYFLPGYQVFRKFRTLQDQIRKGRFTQDEKIGTIIDLLEEAKEKFEFAIELNPFGKNFQTAVRSVYNSLERYYSVANKDDKKQFVDEKRYIILNKILCYEKRRIQIMGVHQKLGKMYWDYKDWENAEKHFLIASELIFESEDAKIDSNRLFQYLYYRGDSQLKLYKADYARTSFEYARQIAPSELWYNRLTNLIKYINWDDGNIKASEVRQSALIFANQKKFEEAEKKYRDLINIIKTQSALYSAQLQLANIQFFQLDKKEEGINRLWNIVEKLPLTPDRSFPADTSLVRHWNYYARMCFSLGNEKMQTNKKQSFAYYYKISTMECPIRGKAFLSLANLTTSNSELCLEYCNRAHDYLHQLVEVEKIKLFELMYQMYSVRGDFDEALTWFKKAKQGNLNN